MLNFLKKSFITGLILTLPLGITIFFVHVLLNYVGGPASKVLFREFAIGANNMLVTKIAIDAVSIVFVSAIIVCIGALSKLVFGRLLISWTEKVIENVPFIRGVYKTVKQIIETFGQTQKQVFSKTVLIEYPRKGCYAIGFVASEAVGEINDKVSRTVLNIFIPTTPNPTSGFLLMVPREEVIMLDISITDGMKLVISGGIVVPPQKQINKQQKGK